MALHAEASSYCSRQLQQQQLVLLILLARRRVRHTEHVAQQQRLSV
jgi:hypothetical protein